MQVLNRYKIDKGTPGVYIGRPSPLGNPFEIGEHSTREEVVALYEDYLLSKLAARDPDVERAFRALNPSDNLICYCAPAACHGHVIKSFYDTIWEELDYEMGLLRLRALKGKIIDPTKDGITHINIYSKASTKLGRALPLVARLSKLYEAGSFLSWSMGIPILQGGEHVNCMSSAVSLKHIPVPRKFQSYILYLRISMSLVCNLVLKESIMSNIEKQFLSQLRKKKLLAGKSDSAISSGGVEGEELLLEKWQRAAENFIHRGRKVKVGMKADRQYYGESFCYPIVEVE